ncbi:hypothetical protein FDG2_0932 [Candidatus Protofrankia californiensis]|uniref:Uncharacterized protein n=1 Tax=Candidatus Protofrankia californiensis TaxID=1839754 RepID=A0A1C3NUM8_9ACTN|nr:hypothetical protein FDG2_0932 [Candidatus Protofrankia californiensis]
MPPLVPSGAWGLKLCESDTDTAALIVEAIDRITAVGPTLGRPLVDTIEHSTLRNLKELRRHRSHGTGDPPCLRRGTWRASRRHHQRGPALGEGRIGRCRWAGRDSGSIRTGSGTGRTSAEGRPSGRDLERAIRMSVAPVGIRSHRWVTAGSGWPLTWPGSPTFLWALPLGTPRFYGWGRFSGALCRSRAGDGRRAARATAEVGLVWPRPSRTSSRRAWARWARLSRTRDGHDPHKPLKAGYENRGSGLLAAAAALLSTIDTVCRVIPLKFPFSRTCYALELPIAVPSARYSYELRPRAVLS